MSLSGSNPLITASLIDAFGEAWVYYKKHSSPWVFNVEEQRLSDDILERHGNRPFFHGGCGNLSVEDKILPAGVHALNPYEHGWYSEKIDFFHLSVSQEIVKDYKLKVVDGAIYKASPDNTLTMNPVAIRTMITLRERSDIPNAFVLRAFGLAI